MKTIKYSYTTRQLMCLWRCNLDDTIDITTNKPNNWSKSSLTKDEFLMSNREYKLINKKEAKSLFPLAFPK